MFVPAEAAVIGSTVLEKIDLVLDHTDHTDQHLGPNSAHPDQWVSQVK
jgi:hypothetical protein